MIPIKVNRELRQQVNEAKEELTKAWCAIAEYSLPKGSLITYKNKEYKVLGFGIYAGLPAYTDDLSNHCCVALKATQADARGKIVLQWVDWKDL